MKIISIVSFIVITMLPTFSVNQKAGAAEDYFSYFAKNADIPHININIKLPSMDPIKPIQKYYLDGEYGNIAKGGHRSSFSQQDDYIYFQTLSHLKEWRRLYSEVADSKYFSKEFLKSSYKQMHLEAAIRMGNLSQARMLYSRYKEDLKQFIPYSHIINLVDELASLTKEESFALSKGGYFYYRYKTTKDKNDFKRSLQYYYPKSINLLSANDYQSYFKTNDPVLMEYAKKSYSALYISMLKKNKEYSKLGQYYFNRGKFSSASGASPKGSFYYHMSKLMTHSKSSTQNDSVSFAKKNLSKSAYYLSTYYYNRDNFQGVLDTFIKYPASRTIRYLVVLGLNNKQYQSVYNALVTHYNNGTTFSKLDRTALYYWLAYLSNKLEKTLQSRKIYMKAAAEYPYTYYGWESYKSISNSDAKAVMRQWGRYYDQYKPKYKDFLNKMKSYTLPKNNINIEKALFFFTIREDGRALTYLRRFLNSQQAKWYYYDDLVKEFYRIRRMDYYVAYNRFIYNEIDQLSGYKNQFFTDLMTLNLPLIYKDDIKNASKYFDVEESSLQSLILQESNYDYRAVSWVGAQGLAQLMPATAKPILVQLYKKNLIKNKDVFDPYTNIMLGASYFNWLYHKMYKDYPPTDRIVLSYASYNAGPGRIKKMYHSLKNRENTPHFIESIAFQESRNYSKALLLKRDLYKYFRGVK